MVRKCAAILVGGALLLGVVLLASSCSRTGEPGSRRNIGEEESAMKPEAQAALSPGDIPPIDAAAPENFETATFGLG